MDEERKGSRAVVSTALLSKLRGGARLEDHIHVISMVNKDNFHSSHVHR